jgi:hypothetical protein
MGEGGPARRVKFKGRVEFRREADDLTPAPGDSALVERGRPRSFVLACPDGCGEHLTINLDDCSGPAWRWYETKRGVTLFPSVWRDSGCKSHFIIWHDRILWCDWYTEGNKEPENLTPELPDRVFAVLDDDFTSFAALGLRLDEIPWEVARACRSLKADGRAEEDVKPRLGHYRRTRTLGSATKLPKQAD